MTEIKEKLTAYGVDYPVVMERFVNDEELYYDCICTFMDDPAFSSLGDALKNKDYSAAFDHAHTLKGVSANLGLTPLYKAICAIVEPLRSKDYENVEGLYGEAIKAKEYLQTIINSK